MVVVGGSETYTSAMSRDVLEALKAALNDSKESVQEILESFVNAILETTLEEMQKLVETFLEAIPYITDEQHEALKMDLVVGIFKNLLDGEPRTLEALREAIRRLQKGLEQNDFQFAMPKLPGLLELGENEAENAAWEAARDAFRGFWADLKPSRQNVLEAEFRREFQLRTEGVFAKKA